MLCKQANKNNNNGSNWDDDRWRGNYLFSMIGKSSEAEKERKRHDLAIEQLQRAEFEYQHKRQLRLDYLNKQLRAEEHSALVFEDVDAAAHGYWLVTGGDQ